MGTGKGRGKERNPKVEAFWREQVGRWEESGLSARQFSREEGLAVHSLYFWKREIRRRDGEKQGKASVATTEEEKRELPEAGVEVEGASPFSRDGGRTSLCGAAVGGNFKRAGGGRGRGAVPRRDGGALSWRVSAGDGRVRARGVGTAGGLGTIGAPAMLRSPGTLRVHLCLQPADMRRSFDGLSAMAQQVVRQDPLSGHLFMFRNRRGDYLKILYWDRDGFAIWAKRLERGTFRFPRPDAGVDAVEVSRRELWLLLEGADPKSVRWRPRYQRPAV